MKRIILLRFHKDIDLVQNRIDLLKYFNPNIEIYGLFGGEKGEYDTFVKNLTNIENIYYLDIQERDIKWRFSDYGILQWYVNFGKMLDFDVVHTIEYDLVLLDTLERLYPYQTGNANIYITSLIELEKIKSEWNWFIHPDFPVAESVRLERVFKEDYGIKKLYGSMAPGTTLTKAYLDGYAKLHLPLIGHDELRLPNIAQILGIEMQDTGFVKDWFAEEGLDFRLFNCDNHPVDKKELMEAYIANYQKAFHPVYFPIEISELKQSN